MKDITTFINESNNAPIFNVSESEIRCDGKTLIGAIYSKDMKITDHAESYEEAVTMIERDCDRDDMLYFIKWNNIRGLWETASVTFYWTKGHGDEILVSSEGDSKTKEKLKRDFTNTNYVLVVVRKK